MALPIPEQAVIAEPRSLAVGEAVAVQAVAKRPDDVLDGHVSVLCGSALSLALGGCTHAPD